MKVLLFQVSNADYLKLERFALEDLSHGGAGDVMVTAWAMLHAALDSRGREERACACATPDLWGRARRPLTWRCLTCGNRPTLERTVKVQFVDAGPPAPSSLEAFRERPA